MAPIAIEWGEHAQNALSDQFVYFGATAIPLYVVDLYVGAVQADGSIDIRLSSETLSATYRSSISASFPAGYRHTRITGLDVGFKKKNKDVVPLDEHLAVDPFIVRYADGTYSYNYYHIPTSLNAGRFPDGAPRILALETRLVKPGVFGQGRRYRARRATVELDVIIAQPGASTVAINAGREQRTAREALGCQVALGSTYSGSGTWRSAASACDGPPIYVACAYSIPRARKHVGDFGNSKEICETSETEISRRGDFPPLPCLC